MPYITTTLKPQWGEPSLAVARRSSHAVATLEEAQDRIVCDPLSAHDEHPLFPHWRSQALMLPESGGAIGPLPDGTVIEVQQVKWVELAEMGLGHEFNPAGSYYPKTLLDAFNAR